jgi:acetolactate synthase small subunit
MLISVTYMVTAENRHDVLARVVVLLHRLAVPIDALTVKRSTKSRTLLITLKAEVIAGQVERIAENLLKLVPVTSVEIGPRRTKFRPSVQDRRVRNGR